MPVPRFGKFPPPCDWPEFAGGTDDVSTVTREVGRAPDDSETRVIMKVWTSSPVGHTQAGNEL